MKIAFVSLFAVGALTLHSFAQAPVGVGAVKLGKVQPAVVKTPEIQFSGGTQKRSRIGEWLEVEVDYETKPEEIDELTFKFTIMVEKKVLDGESTYVNIGKGREHFAVVYVSPKSLEKLTGGKALTGASIENVVVEVSKAGQILDKTSFKGTPIPNLPHLAGMVMNKDETPFGPLYYDRYETLKKMSR